MHVRYPIIIEPETNTSCYGGIIPDIPGCFSAGDINPNPNIETWQVTRTDDNGHTFVIRAGMTEDEATELFKVLETRGHKQFYQIKKSS